jgi:hypothetical protein
MRFRVEQVETLLKSQDPADTTPKSATDGSKSNFSGASHAPPTMRQNSNTTSPSMGNNLEMPPMSDMSHNIDDSFGFGDNMATDPPMAESFPWEMIGLGLEEPLPDQDTIDDLYEHPKAFGLPFQQLT